VRIALCLGILLALARAAAAQQPLSAPEPILENGELMLMVIKPAYDDLKRAMASPPADRAQWAQLYQKAARLAEFENLILIRRERPDRPEWKSLAADARTSSALLASLVLKSLGAAQDADVAMIRKAYEDVSGRCNACHRAMSREAPRITPD
jgi:hypothetical protein